MLVPCHQSIPGNICTIAQAPLPAWCMTRSLNFCTTAQQASTEFLVPVPGAMQAQARICVDCHADPCCVALCREYCTKVRHAGAMCAFFTHQLHGLVDHHGACLQFGSSASRLSSIEFCSRAWHCPDHQFLQHAALPQLA